MDQSRPTYDSSSESQEHHQSGRSRPSFGSRDYNIEKYQPLTDFEELSYLAGPILIAIFLC